MKEDNEENVVTDVPEETSEENLEENVTDNASEGEEQNQDTTDKVETSEEDIEKQIEERANALFEEKVEKRLARDRASQKRKFNKELSKYKELENVMKAGLQVDNLDDAISAASKYYTNEGITIPEYHDARSDRDEKVLAEADAKDIIELGHDEMEAEANRLAGIENRSIREETIFNALCEKLIEDKQINELKDKGIDTSILNDKEFQKFKNQFNMSTPISNIYEMYMLKNKSAEKPASAGSAKSDNSNTGEIFSPERINNMTQQEMLKYWDNPAFRKAAGLN